MRASISDNTTLPTPKHRQRYDTYYYRLSYSRRAAVNDYEKSLLITRLWVVWLLSLLDYRTRVAKRVEDRERILNYFR